MMKIAVLPGDDIGPEITAAVVDVLESANARFDLGLETERHEVGIARHRVCGTTLPDSVVDAARAADGIILGPAGVTLYPSPEATRVVIDPARRTRDLGGSLGTQRFGAIVADRVAVG